MSDEHIKPELKIRHFEGPLDLLFHLIEKNDIDIYDIPIAEITGQYIDFLEDMKKLDMEVTSEFIVMAATLIHIKSRIMLPGKKDEDRLWAFGLKTVNSNVKTGVDPTVDGSPFPNIPVMGMERPFQIRSNSCAGLNL